MTARAVPSLDLSPALAVNLLEELVYERVRRHMDMLELGWFEADLDTAIRRVVEDLDDDGRDEEPSAAIAAALIDRAWRRVEDEWHVHRRQRDDEDCALCALDRRARDELRAEGAR